MLNHTRTVNKSPSRFSLLELDINLFCVCVCVRQDCVTVLHQTVNRDKWQTKQCRRLRQALWPHLSSLRAKLMLRLKLPRENDKMTTNFLGARARTTYDKHDTELAQPSIMAQVLMFQIRQHFITQPVTKTMLRQRKSAWKNTCNMVTKKLIIKHILPYFVIFKLIPSVRHPLSDSDLDRESSQTGLHQLYASITTSAPDLWPPSLRPRRRHGCHMRNILKHIVVRRYKKQNTQYTIHNTTFYIWCI